MSKLEALIVTHAHMDHIGRIPKLVAQGFKGPIYSTVATKELSGATFADAVKIMTMEAQELHKNPLYNASDVFAAMAMWKTLPYHSPFSLSPEVSFELKDSGHILGSAIVEFSIKTDGVVKKVVFTGDLGNSPSLLLHDTEVVDDADYMLMESVYGDRNHEPPALRDETFKPCRDGKRRRHGHHSGFFHRTHPSPPLQHRKTFRLRTASECSRFSRFTIGFESHEYIRREHRTFQ